MAPLRVRSGQAAEFERAFHEAQRIIASMPGHRSHVLLRGVEPDAGHLLIVVWDTLEDHEQGFRGSPRYAEWKALLHHFYDPFPTVRHFEEVPGLGTLARLAEGARGDRAKR